MRRRGKGEFCFRRELISSLSGISARRPEVNKLINADHLGINLKSANVFRVEFQMGITYNAYSDVFKNIILYCRMYLEIILFLVLRIMYFER